MPPSDTIGQSDFIPIVCVCVCVYKVLIKSSAIQFS